MTWLTLKNTHQSFNSVQSASSLQCGKKLRKDHPLFMQVVRGLSKYIQELRDVFNPLFKVAPPDGSSDEMEDDEEGAPVLVSFSRVTIVMLSHACVSFVFLFVIAFSSPIFPLHSHHVVQ
jgi:hypothetical protein